VGGNLMLKCILEQRRWESFEWNNVAWDRKNWWAVVNT
jgi:hypothetical protein